jgi:hypothetical protein
MGSVFRTDEEGGFVDLVKNEFPGPSKICEETALK